MINHHFCSDFIGLFSVNVGEQNLVIMNQAPGDWGMRFNSGPQGMPQRFGMQMGGAGMNMMNRNMSPRFGMNMMNQNMNMMNQQRMNMMNQQNMMMNQQNMNMMNQQRMNMMNQQRMNMMNQQRMNMMNQQNQGMGNFGVGPGMGFGGQITGMDNTDNDQGPGFDEQDKDMEDDGATPAKVAKKDTSSTDEKTETVSKIEKKDTKSDAKSAGDTKIGKKDKQRTEDPKPDIEKLRKYHIPKRDSSKDEDPTNETEEPTSILDQAFDNKPKTYNYNKRLNETISTKGPRPLMNIFKDKEQNSYNTRKSGPNATDVNRKEPMSLMSLSFDPSKKSGPYATDVNRKEPMSLMSLSFDPPNLGHGENVKDSGNNSAMFGMNIAAENFKVPMPLAAYISNTGQHGGRHLDQPIEGMGNTGPLAFVQSKDSLKSVPMKKNLSFVDSEQDQDSDAEGNY